MPHLHRFYIAPETPTAEVVALSSEEAHHAVHVVRLRAGEAVELFDGQGRILAGIVRIEGKRSVSVEVSEETRTPPPSETLTLIQAWLNHDKGVDAIIRDCTALGVREFRFFRGGHSERAPRRPDRWKHIAVESCKQCGRSWLPTFREAPNLEAALDGIAEPLFVASNELPPSPLCDQALEKAAAVIVGPEGDFTEEELAVAKRHRAKSLSLGPATLRSEVAATTASVLLLYELGAFGAGPAGNSSSSSSRK